MVFASSVPLFAAGAFASGALPTAPAPALGIPLALAGAVALSGASTLQHRGVNAAVAQTERERLARERERGDVVAPHRRATVLRLRQVIGLLHQRVWIAGALLLVLSVALQLTSLAIAPLIVVQPLGAASLVVTTLLQARATGVRPTGAMWRALILAVGGVGAFSAVAAVVASRAPHITQRTLEEMLTLLTLTLVVTVAITALRHGRLPFAVVVAAAGLLSGSIVTLAKTVIARVLAGDIDGLTVLCVLGLALAVGGNGYLAQSAYALAPPDLVIAGLTVGDAIVAVLLGVLVLDEATGAPLWAVVVFVLAGAAAVVGVWRLARAHARATAPARPLATDLETA
jgi:drug/metabolite transporter (DMT)-like permease